MIDTRNLLLDTRQHVRLRVAGIGPLGGIRQAAAIGLQAVMRLHVTGTGLGGIRQAAEISLLAMRRRVETPQVAEAAGLPADG